MFLEKQNGQLIDNTLSILKDRNVEVVCKLPNSSSKMQNLKVKFPDNGVQAQKFSFKMSETQINRDNAETDLLRLIKENSKIKEIHLMQFFFNRLLQKDSTMEVYYGEKFGDCIVFDNSVRAVVYSDRIEGEIKYRQLEIMDEKQPIMQINQVLLKNFKTSNEKIKIEQIRCGYIQKMSKTKPLDNIYIPVWELVTGDGKIRYYKAFTGEAMII